MTANQQSELALSRSPSSATLPLEMVRMKKSAGSAFRLACDASGLDDKEIYMALGIDAGYFSNITKDKATLQANLIKQFCSVVGNTVYPEWCAYQVGCKLVMIQTEAERRAVAEKDRADKLEAENKLMRELLAGRS